MGDAPDVITFMASKARRHRRVARWSPLGQINRLRPLIQLDAGSPGVGDECNPDANVVHAVGSVGVELNAGRSQLGDECFQILHIETDVIEDPALRRPFRHIDLGRALRAQRRRRPQYFG